jgi:hypothetical protein
MEPLMTVAGLALIGIGARDIFDTLFHPHGRGVVGEWITALIWRIFVLLDRGSGRTLTVAGPLAFFSVIVGWVLLVSIGGALIIEPRMPDGFVLAQGLEPEQASGLFDALYYSLVSLTSLGFGDLSATGDLLRMLGPLQALIGLSLVAASVSWILSVYRVLTGTTVLARKIGLVCEAERPRFEQVAPDAQCGVLADLGSGLIEARRNLLHFPIAYRFHPHQAADDLCVPIGGLLTLSTRLASSSDSPAVRFHASMLERSIADLLAAVDDEFLGGHGGDGPEIVERWRRDQRRDRHPGSGPSLESREPQRPGPDARPGGPQ